MAINWEDIPDDVKRDYLTPRQIEVMDVYSSHGPAKASEAFNIATQNVHALKNRVLKRLSNLGHAPGHWNTGAAPGYGIGKVTIQRNSEGVIERSWERQLPIVEDIKAAMEEAIAALKDEIPKLPKVKSPSLPRCASKLMNAIIVGDPHLDMLSYDRETGKDWDSAIANMQHRLAMEDLIKRAPQAETGMLCILGDSLHRDSLKAVTPGSGNLVDVDGRLSRSFELAVTLFRYMIDKMLETHKRVIVSIVRGNHSETLELCLRVCLQVALENNKRAEVLDNTSKHIPFVFGKNFLLMTHGDRLSAQKKADIAVSKYREQHGGAKFTHVISGHLHHEETKEISGVLVEVFQALPTPDAWHHESGYVTSDQAVNMLTYHEAGGIIDRAKTYPRIFMEEAA